MNIHEALKTIPNKKKLYFIWKHYIGFDQTKPPKTEAEFLKTVDLKSLSSFVRWERSEEYRALLAILLNTRFDSDLEQIYDSLADKAKNGDEKSIKLLLQIGKDIKSYAKDAAKTLNKNDEVEEDDDLDIG
ncbi:hypothetical protein [Paenibacillus durus]|uniref:Homeodomain phBC6A51-type domain-containing protein n=1 Tax=Paenibacillus durus ATCC 35681 TaxID=1333534 RepID=A0A0F7F9P6_PAEDU|nr:hypothetical protein [Paenibacillus durus]AKG35253.1 hypothetical protein VK70_12260 [Paenibacillus durus ATCC 35681]